MTDRLRVVPITQVVACTAVLVAVALFAWRPSPDASPMPPVLPPPVAAAPSTNQNATALTDSIVNANIFSLTREAPGDRTVAADPTVMPTEPVSTESYAADAGVADSTAMLPDRETVPSLAGIVDGALGRAALLRLDPAVASALLYRVGEGAAGYRVRSIGADRVELIGPGGSTVVHLSRKTSGTP